jgi:pyruvate dehydrogenase E1 component beta subunit
MTTMALGKAINAGLRKAMEGDSKVLVMGEDVGKLGGVFRVTDGLQKDFGEDRVIDTPLAESGIIGTAVGLALRGYRPVCEIQFDGFVFPGYDQIVSQVAKMHFRSGGRLRVPIVIRIPFGGGIGAVEHHSESPEAYFAHTPGLKVVAVSSPAWTPRLLPPRKAGRSRSSTFARCPPSTCRSCTSRSERPGAAWLSTRRSARSESEPR